VSPGKQGFLLEIKAVAAIEVADRPAGLAISAHLALCPLLLATFQLALSP